MEEYTRYMRIADDDPVKLARMLEIQSWFDNKDQLAAISMAKYLQQSKKAAILPKGVAWEYIELLLWAMEQTDSPNPIVRQRWWEYRSKMEHPPEIEGSSIYRVPFVRVSCQSECRVVGATYANGWLIIMGASKTSPVPGNGMRRRHARR